MSQVRRTRTPKDRLRRAYRRHRVIRILAGTVDRQDKVRLDASLEEIERFSNSRARAILPRLEAAVKEDEELLGVKGSTREMERLLAAVEESYGLGAGAADDHICFVSKQAILEFFDRYERSLPVFGSLPVHARIGIDPRGAKRGLERGVFLLEASLFEDMAGLWNQALDLLEVASQSFEWKIGGAVVRATAKAAFNLVEGYLNGLAVGILYRKRPSAAEREMLEEWSKKRDSPRFIGLRDKLYQYPKIATGSSHPPMTAENDSDLANVLEAEKRLRHALIHPTPLIRRDDVVPREFVYQQIEPDDVAPLCDAVLRVIVKISRCVGPEFGDVSTWLRERGDDGRFPEEAFR